MMVYHHKTGC